MIEVTTPNRRIKWGYALGRIATLPETVGGLEIGFTPGAPEPGDILLAEVELLGQHTRMDLQNLTRSQLFVGDVVGVAFAHRYATRQFECRIPPELKDIHFVCAGGICSRVVGKPYGMAEPTRLRPLGYALRGGSRSNLRDRSLRPVPAHVPPVIVVVGTSMDSGKTTAAYSLINGLTRSGLPVAAGKITGTASAKDPLLMISAGAHPVYDFTDVGYGSTAGLGRSELAGILQTLMGGLAAQHPKALVLEIADGVTQPETALMLELILAHLATEVVGVIYTCNDALGVKPGVERLEACGLRVLCVSGTVTASPLGVAEAQRETHVPVLSREDLMDPSIGERLNLFHPSKTVGDMDRAVVTRAPATP